jgi:hypothetical protein
MAAAQQPADELIARVYARDPDALKAAVAAVADRPLVEGLDPVALAAILADLGVSDGDEARDAAVESETGQCRPDQDHVRQR